MVDLVDVAMKLTQYAAEHPDENDASLAREALYIMAGWTPDNDVVVELDETVEGVAVREYDYMAYVIPENEGDMTIAVLDGDVMLGTVAELVHKINCDYADKAGKTICQCCGSFEYRWCGPSDCDNCGELVDGSGPKNVIPVKERIRTALPGCTELEDGDYEHVWVCDTKLPTHLTPANHTWLFVRVMYMEEHERNPRYRFHGEICAANIGMAGKKGWKAVCGSLGMDPEEPIEPLWKAKELVSSGMCATLFQGDSNSKVDLVQKLNRALQGVHLTGSFQLDAPQNRIGSSGWDFMRGDILAGMERGPDSLNKQIMRMMAGL